MENVELNNEEQTLEEQYQELEETIAKELARFNKKTIDFTKRNGKGEAIPEEETKLHKEHEKMISQLEKARKQLFNMLYPKGKKIENLSDGKPDIHKVTQKESSVGALIRKIS